MSRQLTILGNWKMAQSLSAGQNFLKNLKLPKSKRVQVGIYPSFVHLQTLAAMAPADLWMGAQDCSSEKSGAFTGEISADMLKELKLKSVLIGHSERRQRGHETNESLQKKLTHASEAGLRPIFCIGEHLAERKANQVEKVLTQQLEALDDEENALIAYEPVWAIGTGVKASAKEISEAHRLIRSLRPGLAVLYGGSVSAENCKEILGIPEVDGLLIGGASLQLESFSKILEVAESFV